MRKYWVRKSNDNGVAVSRFVRANSPEEAIRVVLRKDKTICTEEDWFKVTRIGRQNYGQIYRVY